MKHCSKCGENKPETEFYKNSRMSDGLTFHCKECQDRTVKAWRQANPDKVAAASQRWRDKHPGRSSEASKKYYNKKKGRSA